MDIAAGTANLEAVVSAAATDALNDAICVISDEIARYRASRVGDSDGDETYDCGYLDGLDDAILTIRRRLLTD